MALFATSSPDLAGDRATGAVLLVSALAGASATSMMVAGEFRELVNPVDAGSCSTAEHFSCMPVMADPRAQLLGVPNSFLGLLMFAALLAASAGVLASPRPLARWFWVGLQAATSIGLVLVHAFAFQASFVIGALCSGCLVVWAVTITAFVHVSARNVAAHRACSRRVASPPGPPASPASAFGPAMISLVWVLMLLGAAIGVVGVDR